MTAELREKAPSLRAEPVVTAAATVLCAAAALAGPVALAVPGGLLLAFLLPGLALNALIFRYRRLSAVERTVLAPALSMATMIVTGLGLYVAGFKLDRISWTLATAGVTLAVLALRAVPERVWHGEEDDAPIPEIGGETPLPGPFAPPVAGYAGRKLFRHVLLLVAVAGVLGGAGWLSYSSSHNSYEVTVTALSAAPPGDVTAAGTRQVSVSASGLVVADGPYTVAVIGPSGVRTQELTVPADRTTWTADLSLPAETRATIALYRTGDTTPYRTVVISAAE